ncbi:alpha/beta fold hydrolase [Gordonia sihwensis]|uniref:alpha/beta fold hydrolase n=1 Tax=Gordonia sihwensis TaxID=173559 RepID=UPI003D970CCD
MKIKVSAEDGTVLATNIHNPAEDDLTLVLLHGFCMNSNSWARARSAVERACPTVRVISYDHRGHGHSGQGPRRSHTIDILADDLGRVLTTVAPTGRLVLAGHSLGAMTILAHLRRNPSTLDRVSGLCLVATASSRLSDHGGLARLLPAAVARALPSVADRIPTFFESAWAVARTVLSPALGTCGNCGRPSAAVLAELLASLRSLDESASLPLLRALPTVVLAGAFDRITPVGHSRTIAAAAPLSTLRVLPRAGHNLPLTHPQAVGRELVELVTKGCRQSSRNCPYSVVEGVNAVVASV